MLEVDKHKIKRLLRVALYSHDTLGLGHIRRNLLLAETVANAPVWASVLLISGTSDIGRFRLCPGVDSVSLPAYYKSSTGTYEPRRLGINTASLVKIRARAIETVLEEYAVDLLIVDNVPRGTKGELEGVLKQLRSRGTRCVLGLRDILDDPQFVQQQWLGRDNERFILDHYEQVWIYGDNSIFDAVREYSMSPQLAAKVHYTGYLDGGRKRAYESVQESCSTCHRYPCAPAGKVNLCLVGGGQDGHALASAFARAEQPAGTTGFIVTGPFMNVDAVKELEREVAHRDDLRVLGFVNGVGELIKGARSVITMGGYNTVCEVLSLKRPALIVPRVKPRREQYIRAQRLSEAGFVDMLHPDHLHPGLLSDWMRTAPQRDRALTELDFSGLDRVNDLVRQMLVSGGTHKEADAIAVAS